LFPLFPFEFEEGVEDEDEYDDDDDPVFDEIVFDPVLFEVPPLLLFGVFPVPVPVPVPDVDVDPVAEFVFELIGGVVMHVLAVVIVYPTAQLIHLNSGVNT
jgi:hypothetical protein